jgi:hypothetical protein
MTKCKMGRAVSLAFLASTAAFGLVVSVADASDATTGSGCFARFTYARAMVNWVGCSGTGGGQILDLEAPPGGACSLSVDAATVAGQCAAPFCDFAQATGSSTFESFFASAFTFQCPSVLNADAEIRYTLLRRAKTNTTVNTVVGPTVYLPRGNHTLVGPWREISGIFLPMDINEDGIVDGRDLAQLLHEWGSTSPTTLADTNCDGIVDLTDLSRLLATWKTDGATP